MIPALFTSGSLIAPSSALISSGYVAGSTLGAQHFNWYLNHLTTELNNLLLAAGVAQNTGDDTQLLQSILTLIVAPQTVTANTTFGQFAGNAEVTVNAAGATTQNVTAGAARAGNTLVVYNAGAGLVSLTLSATTGDVVDLAQHERLCLTWNGVAWEWEGLAHHAVSAAYTLPGRHSNVTLDVTAGASQLTVTLGTLAANAGREVRVRKIDTGAGEVKVAPNGAETFNYNAATYAFTYVGLPGQQVTVDARPGSGWYYVSGVVQPVALEPDIGGGWHRLTTPTNDVWLINTAFSLYTWTNVDFSSVCPPGTRMLRATAYVNPGPNNLYVALSNSENINVRNIVAIVSPSSGTEITLPLSAERSCYVATSANTNVLITKRNCYLLGPV